MNHLDDLENDLRKALQSGARAHPVSSDAWERTSARFRRPRPTLPGKRWLLPLAASIAVAAMALLVTALVDQPASRGIATGAHPARPWPTPAGPYPVSGSALPQGPQGGKNYLLTQFPAASDIMRFDPLPGGLGEYLFLWLGTGKVDSDGHRGLGACNEEVDSNGAGGGGCGPFRPWRAGETVRPYNDGTVPITQRRGPQNRFQRMVESWGYALPQVAAVTAVLPDGTRYPGQIGRVRGWAYKVWRVAVPGEPKHVTFVFSDAAGRSLKSFRVDVKVCGTGPWC